MRAGETRAGVARLHVTSALLCARGVAALGWGGLRVNLRRLATAAPAAATAGPACLAPNKVAKQRVRWSMAAALLDRDEGEVQHGDSVGATATGVFGTSLLCGPAGCKQGPGAGACSRCCNVPSLQMPPEVPCLPAHRARNAM
eukprot:364906-Chlamydomonas_euryale.AAC.8